MSFSFHKSQAAGNKVSSLHAVREIKIQQIGHTTALSITGTPFSEQDPSHGCADNQLPGTGKSQQCVKSTCAAHLLKYLGL